MSTRSILVAAIWASLVAAPAIATASAPTEQHKSGEELYKRLSEMAHKEAGGAAAFDRLTEATRAVDWNEAQNLMLFGNLRQLQVPTGDAKGDRDFYLIHTIEGEVHILAFPDDATEQTDGSKSPYAELEEKIGSKMSFKVRVVTRVVDGVGYSFVALADPPERILLDRLFFIAIILLLFLTMVGMGLTLTLKDFGLIVRKPLGMIYGTIFQFVAMPLLAMAIGRLVGYYETFPFIFLGLILITSSPGGVTSNLMTYLGKGDVALSVSLTAVSTVLAMLFTPLLLSLYGANIPDFDVPAMEVFKVMLGLVIIPLVVGMIIRWRAERFAKRAEKIFAAIGVFALLFLIVVGVWSNLDKLADTSRYGVKFYSVIFVLTLVGMMFSGLIAKLLRITNFQTRAISLECGMRNASLAMTMAILLQDRMGDFYSSMFVTSGIFGLWMYLAGGIVIFLFPKWLPVTKPPDTN